MINVEKSKWASYQLKDVAQSWYKVWKDSRALRGGPTTWDLFKMAFLEWFFPRKMKDAKVKKFVNRKQGSMLFKDYYLKFVRLYC